MSPLPLRLKLTLVFATAMAVLLSAVGLFLYFRTKINLDNAINSALRSRSRDLSILVSSGSRSLEGSDAFFQVLDRDGRILASSPAARRSTLLSSREIARARTQPLLHEHDETLRLLARPVQTPSHTPVIT